MITHLACIMDGNRRWAMRQNLANLLGHQKGIETINTVVDFCLAKKIPYLSLYAYSIENLHNRSQEEQYYLFGKLAQEAAHDIDIFKRKNVRIQFIGDRSLFPQSMYAVCERIEHETAECSGLLLSLLFCYGGQQEIVDAAKRIAIEVACGALSVNDITPQLFSQHLWTSSLPSPDLIIRTGDQQRLSNFLLYQAAYSELYFLTCMWPDITHQELESALMHYHECRKMFGK